MLNDLKIYELKVSRSESKEYSKQVAQLHMQAFPHFFLTQMGSGFLTTLYHGYLQDEESGLIIAEDENNCKIVGFIAYSKDYSGFYKRLLQKDLFVFVIYSLGALIRHPGFIKRLLGAFGKSNEVKRTVKYVELASIGVHPQRVGQGIGSRLISYLVKHTDFERYAYISLETDAENNEKTNRFYQKNGFTFARLYTTYEGRKMNEYHLYG